MNLSGANNPAPIQSKVQHWIHNFLSYKNGNFTESQTVFVPEQDMFWRLSVMPCVDKMRKVDSRITFKFLGFKRHQDFVVKANVFCNKNSLMESTFACEYNNDDVSFDLPPSAFMVSSSTTWLWTQTCVPPGSVVVDVNLQFTPVKPRSKRRVVGESTQVSVASQTTELLKEPAEEGIRFLRQFKGAFEDDTFSDFSFIVNEQIFKVHKIIVASGSPVLKGLIIADQKISDKCNIAFTEPQTFTQLLRFIYGEPIVDRDILSWMKMYEAAQQFQVDPLKIISKAQVEARCSLDNAAKIYEWSTRWNLEELKTKSWTLIDENILETPYKEKLLPPSYVQNIIDLRNKQKQIGHKNKKAKLD